ncbi:hypothetical protein J3E69DRAFT_339669 [Trichoderma sp. SZMC 28015]
MFHEQCCNMQSAQGRFPGYSAVSGVRAHGVCPYIQSNARFGASLYLLGTWYLVVAETAILLLAVGSRHSGILVRTSSLCYATFCFVFPFLFFSFPRSSPPGPAKKQKRKQ